MARKLDGTILWGAAALAGLAWLIACGDGAVEPAEPTVPDPPRATTVAVTPATAELTRSATRRGSPPRCVTRTAK